MTDLAGKVWTSELNSRADVRPQSITRTPYVSTTRPCAMESRRLASSSARSRSWRSHATGRTRRGTNRSRLPESVGRRRRSHLPHPQCGAEALRSVGLRAGYSRRRGRTGSPRIAIFRDRSSDQRHQAEGLRNLARGSGAARNGCDSVRRPKQNSHCVFRCRRLARRSRFSEAHLLRRLRSRRERDRAGRHDRCLLAGGSRISGAMGEGLGGKRDPDPLAWP